MYDSVLRQLAAARPLTSTSWRERTDVPGTGDRARDAAGRRAAASAGSGRTSHVTHLDRARAPRSASGSTTCATARRGTPSAPRAAPSVSASACRRAAAPHHRLAAASAPRPAGERWWPCLRLVERALPRQPELDALMREHAARRRAADAAAAPRIVADRGAAQRARLRRAHRRSAWRAGITCPARRGSREMPDRGVRVERHAEDAKPPSCTACPRRSVVVTGAQCYDQWFGRGAGPDARGVLRDGGPAGRSARSCSTPARRCRPRRPPRRAFVRRWIEALRRERRSGAAIGGRPGAAASAASRRVEGGRSVASSRRDASTARIRSTSSRRRTTSTRCTTARRWSGLLTSVFLEASILGKPVHTLVLPEFVERQ